ncbi:INO80 complex subunit D-like [Saccostrea cucullata]|uniref:INO80 complex subunit D-like n=1 Tax=Saccostrea cuccullata TaxID=36930 RepID=UPI002ED58204
MYEGKNIHYTSGADHKPLCSFSAKICNQHRLNGYGFCVRHILEDPTAPFRRCAYVAKSSKQMCTQAIPLHEKREYCNNHMQVLGMLPKKEKKPKPPKTTVQHLPTVPRDKLPFKDRVSRFNSSKLNSSLPGNDLRRLSNVLKSDVFNAQTEDVDDPYAFTDPGGEEKTITTVNTLLPSSSPYHEPPLSVGSQGSHGSKSPGDGGMGVSSIAKLYPELAEKLEKIKPKFDTGSKAKEKGKAKSSRTMNRLQTKIAQNRIKDKLKRNQESNSQSQSPCYNFNSSSASSAVNHYDFIDRTVPSNSNETSPRQQTQGILNSSSHKRNSVNSLPVYLMPHGVNSVTETAQNFSLPGQGFLPHGIPHGMPLELLPGMPNSVPKLPQNFISSEMVMGLSSFPIPQEPIQNHLGSTSLPLSSTVAHLSSQNSVKDNISTLAGEALKQKNIQEKEKYSTLIPSKQQPPPVPPPPSYSQSIASGYSPSIKTTAEIKTDTQPVLGVTHKDIPPPPPYESKPVKTNKSKTSTHALFGSNVINDLPSSAITRPHKFKMECDDAVLKKKFKKDEVVNFYKDIVKQKKEKHDLVGAGFDSLDETSDSESEEILSWQPDWFSPSSDEEMPEDEEEAADILRTTKLALLRARYRRRCFQYRKSHKTNHAHQKSKNSTTLALIKASREGPKEMVAVVKEMMHQQDKIIDRFKKRGLERRQCSYKPEDEEQCKNPVLPYTNHCLSHIMYNVDQQLFDYCTAKFADNTQCCTPVFDIRHELPLCMEHAMKADNYFKDQDSESKQKRIRKKTKPSALTRPPRKGKKKKNARKPPRPQKPSPPSEPTGITGMPVAVPPKVPTEPPPVPPSSGETKQFTTPQPEESINNTVSPVTVPAKPQNSPPVAAMGGIQVKTRQEKNSLTELSENMLGGVDNFNTELPLEQASKLLEEPDFQDVFNKLPDEAFNLFGKNGDFNPTSEEFEELERHLAAANMDVTNAQKTFENFDLDLDEEQLKQILFGSGNSSTNTGSMAGLNNREDQESINAIARSLSASEQLLPKTTVSETNIPFSGASVNSYQTASVTYPQIPGQGLATPNKTVTQNSIMYTNNSHYSQFQTPPSYAATQAMNNPTPPAYVASQALVNQTPTNYVISQPMVNQTPPSYGASQALPNHSYPQHITLGSSQVQQVGNHSNISEMIQQGSITSPTTDVKQQKVTTSNKVVLNQLPELASKTQGLPVSMQGSLPMTQTPWPITAGQVPPYQNGYPMHGMYLQGTNDMMTNLKYNMNAQHIDRVNQVGEGSSHHVTHPPGGTLQGIPGFGHQQFAKSFTASSGNGS